MYISIASVPFSCMFSDHFAVLFERTAACYARLLRHASQVHGNMASADFSFYDLFAQQLPHQKHINCMMVWIWPRGWIYTDTIGIGHVTPELRRSLLLVSKVLQNLANGVRFGVKEPLLTPFNAFLDQNALPLDAFFDILTVWWPRG
mgnify:CR=1 FL=1